MTIDYGLSPNIRQLFARPRLEFDIDRSKIPPLATFPREKVKKDGKPAALSALAYIYDAHDLDAYDLEGFRQHAPPYLLELLQDLANVRSGLLCPPILMPSAGREATVRSHEVERWPATSVTRRFARSAAPVLATRFGSRDASGNQISSLLRLLLSSRQESRKSRDGQAKVAGMSSIANAAVYFASYENALHAHSFPGLLGLTSSVLPVVQVGQFRPPPGHILVGLETISLAELFDHGTVR